MAAIELPVVTAASMLLTTVKAVNFDVEDGCDRRHLGLEFVRCRVNHSDIDEGLEARFDPLGDIEVFVGDGAVGCPCAHTGKRAEQGI